MCGVTAVEDRLRDALATRAALVTHVPPPAAARARRLVEARAAADAAVAERANACDRGAATPRGRYWRWLAPLTAAAGVCAVIVTALLVTRPAPRLSTGAEPAGSPPYFITVGHPASAVWATATGRLTATIPAPPHGSGWNAVTATADPRVFYLSATTSTSDDPTTSSTRDQ